MSLVAFIGVALFCFGKQVLDYGRRFPINQTDLSLRRQFHPTERTTLLLLWGIPSFMLAEDIGWPGVL